MYRLYLEIKTVPTVRHLRIQVARKSLQSWVSFSDPETRRSASALDRQIMVFGFILFNTVNT